MVLCQRCDRQRLDADCALPGPGLGLELRPKLQVDGPSSTVTCWSSPLSQTFCASKRFQAACAVNDFSTFSTGKWRPLSPPRDVRLPKPSTVSAAVFAPSCSPPTLSVSLSGQSLAGNSLDPGSRSLTTMVRRRRLVPVRRAHLKFVGIERKTQRRYNKAVEKFFIFCTFFHGSQPNPGEELNFLLNEFVNHLWQDDEPYKERGRRGRCRSSVPTDVPKPHEHSASIPAQLGPDKHGPSGAPAPALCSPGHRRSRGALRGLGDGAACYIGYLCLLRTGEILTLKVQHVVHYEESGKSVLCLPDSKGAKRKDVSEFVLVHDPVARQLLRIMMAGKSLDDSVFGLTWASLARGLRASAAAVGIHDPGLSGKSLRRGGATLHFTRFASLDATTSYGRWQLAGTARKYISQAVTDLEEVRLCASGSTRASRLARISSHSLRSNCSSIRLHVLSQFSPTSEAPPDHRMSDEGLGFGRSFLSIRPRTRSAS